MAITQLNCYIFIEAGSRKSQLKLYWQQPRWPLQVTVSCLLLVSSKSASIVLGVWVFSPVFLWRWLTHIQLGNKTIFWSWSCTYSMIAEDLVILENLTDPEDNQHLTRLHCKAFQIII